jgi:hypothetical protein
MRWPWKRRPDDHEAAQRGREIEVKIRAAQDEAVAAIAHAERSKARAESIIRENHLAPRIAAALREHR